MNNSRREFLKTAAGALLLGVVGTATLPLALPKPQAPVGLVATNTNQRKQK